MTTALGNCSARGTCESQRRIQMAKSLINPDDVGGRCVSLARDSLSGRSALSVREPCSVRPAQHRDRDATLRLPPYRRVSAIWLLSP